MSFEEYHFAWQLRLETIFSPAAENAAKRHKSCDEFLVSDPCAGEHKHGGWPIVSFDDTPSKKNTFELAI